MSRIGKQPVQIPAGVTVTVDGTHVTVKGSKGELERTFSDLIVIEEEGNENKLRSTFSPVTQIKFCIDLNNHVINVYNDHTEELSWLADIKDPNANLTSFLRLFEHINRCDEVEYLIRVKNNLFKEFRDLPMADFDMDILFLHHAKKSKDLPAHRNTVRRKSLVQFVFIKNSLPLFIYRAYRPERTRL